MGTHRVNEYGTLAPRRRTVRTLFAGEGARKVRTREREPSAPMSWVPVAVVPSVKEAVTAPGVVVSISAMVLDHCGG